MAATSVHRRHRWHGPNGLQQQNAGCQTVTRSWSSARRRHRLHAPLQLQRSLRDRWRPGFASIHTAGEEAFGARATTTLQPRPLPARSQQSVTAHPSLEGLLRSAEWNEPDSDFQTSTAGVMRAQHGLLEVQRLPLRLQHDDAKACKGRTLPRRALQALPGLRGLQPASTCEPEAGTKSLGLTCYRSG